MKTFKTVVTTHPANQTKNNEPFKARINRVSRYRTMYSGHEVSGVLAEDAGPQFNSTLVPLDFALGPTTQKQYVREFICGIKKGGK